MPSGLAWGKMLNKMQTFTDQILLALLEKLRGRTFAQSVYIRYSVVGLTLFAVLMYFGLRNDLFGSGG